MPRKRPRPVERMTWPQMVVLDQIASGQQPRMTRDVTGLLHRLSPPIELDRRGLHLSAEGLRLCQALHDFWPERFPSRKDP